MEILIPIVIALITSVLGPVLLEWTRSKINKKPSDPLPDAIKYNEPKELFSERELQIIKMICKEYKSKEISDKLFINVRTVETHRKNAMDKCSAKNIIGVILFALKNGMINIDEL
jgi:DNA-binding NarL/FixJ family response regulator